MKFYTHINNINIDSNYHYNIILKLRINIKFANAEDIKKLLLARELKDSTPYIVELREEGEW